VSFRSVGLLCSGTLYVPDGLEPGRKAPAIILASGFAGEKSFGVTGSFAERFSQSGFIALTFDYRHFGDSEGEPRHQLFPLDEVEDVRNAVTWMAGQPEVDASRIGLWGTSYGGGIVVYTATFDRRVKAVIAQIPVLVDIDTRVKQDPEGWTRQGEFLQQDRTDRYTTGRVSVLKIVSAEGEPCALPGKEAFDEYDSLVRGSSKQPPTWRNEITLESLEKIREFDPVHTVPLLSPTPLLIVAAQSDAYAPIEALREVRKRAGEHATLTELPMTHFEGYSEAWLPRVVSTEIEWLKKHAWPTSGLSR
jgi:hypothetical protein